MDCFDLPPEPAIVALPKHSLLIRSADSESHRQDATQLIKQMYAWRGYGSDFVMDEDPGRMTFLATDYRAGNAVGTLTVALDRGPSGLLADRLYHAEAERLRRDGRRLCEMIKFAGRRGVACKETLAALFHMAFIYAYHLHGCTDLLIEVTPQHASFYAQMLHFQPLGEEKLNPRVNTRGVLLSLSLAHCAAQIALWGGKGNRSKDRSLYPYAFSQAQEAVIRERIEADQVLLAA